MLLSVAAGYAIAHFRLEKELIAVLADLPSTQHKVGSIWRENFDLRGSERGIGFTCFLGVGKTFRIDSRNDLEEMHRLFDLQSSF